LRRALVGTTARPGVFHFAYWLLRQLRERIDGLVGSDSIPPGRLCVDFGCGEMPYRDIFLRKFAEYVGVDGEGNREAHAHFTVAGGLPFDDGSVDCVVSTQVLEHVADVRGYLAESRRALRPGGHLVLSTHGIFYFHKVPVDYRRWTMDGLELELASAGFTVLERRQAFGLASSSLTLMQHAALGRMKYAAGRLPVIVLFQSLIGIVEAFRRDRLSPDACVLLLLARKD
jgi:SAM-dependent methyltransferase